MALLFLLPSRSTSTLTFSIDPSTPLNCSTVQDSISSLLNATYHQFWEATSQRFNLPPDPRIILPKGSCPELELFNIWPATQTNIILSSLTRRSQYLGCGEPGRRLELELADLQQDGLLGDAVYVEGVMLELTQHIFGVFGEKGEENSTRFPPTYLEEGKPKPTACSNVPIQGNFTFPCPLEQDCLPSPNQTEVTSSLLYSTNRTMFPEISQFCDSTTHTINSPTPQNLICDGRSVLEVIESSTGSASSSSTSFTAPSITWSSFKSPTFALLMDQGPGTRLHQDPATQLDRRWTAFRTGWSAFFEAWPDDQNFSVFLSEDIKFGRPEPTNVTKQDFENDAYWRNELFNYFTPEDYSANMSVTSRLLELNSTLANLSYPPLIVLSASDEQPDVEELGILMDIIETQQIPVFLFTFSGQFWGPTLHNC